MEESPKNSAMQDQNRSAEVQQSGFLKEFLPAREDLLAFIFSLVPSHADAENLFQEASLVLWQRFDTYTPGTQFKAWARRVIYNKVLNERTRSRKESLWDPQVFEALDRAFSEREPALDGVKKALEQCLKKLPETSQAILLSKYEAGRSYREIARQLLRSEQGIRVTVCKIRNFLARCVKQTLQLEVG
jgi:RNA polymerase sigma-70 factor (ECF subfamily)